MLFSAPHSQTLYVTHISSRLSSLYSTFCYILSNFLLTKKQVHFPLFHYTLNYHLATIQHLIRISHRMYHRAEITAQHLITYYLHSHRGWEHWSSTQKQGRTQHLSDPIFPKNVIKVSLTSLQE